MAIINMLSHADSVKGQGVLSAYQEQVALVKKGLEPTFTVRENSLSKADILHIHTVNPSFFIQNKLKSKHTASVGYVHFLPETMEKSLHLPPFSKWIFYKYIIAFYNACDYLVTVNPCFIPLMQQYGIPREKIVYIPNFVANDKFYKTENKAELREKYGLQADKFTVLGVGQLQHRKGVLDFAELAKRLPHMQFAWAGGFSFGKISNGYDEIKELMKDPPKNLTFLGLVERDEMNDIYNLADVLFQPSYEELFPMTILEAMCCELPLLLRDLPLYEGILGGYYLQGHSNDDFENMLQALENEETRTAASALSKKGNLHYSEDRVLSMWRNFYTAVQKAPAPERFHKKLLRKATNVLHL